MVFVRHTHGIRGRIRGLTKRPNLLKAIAANTVTSVQVEMEAHANKVIRRLRRYPPVPPNSKYIRTNTLKDSWEWPGNTPSLSRVTKDGIVVTIQNDATELEGAGRHYAQLVHGDEGGAGQLQVHSDHHWILMKDAIDRPTYNWKIRKSVHEALK